MKLPHRQPPGATARRLTLVLLLWAALTGCDKAEEAKDRVVKHHRTQTSGRVGVLRGLEVTDRAFSTATSIANRGTWTCGRVRPGPLSVEIKVEVEVMEASGEVPNAVLSETRRISRDKAGAVRAVWQTNFLDTSGRTSDLSREELIIGTDHYVRESNAPFVKHRSHKGDAEALLKRATDAVPAAVAVADGHWRQVDGKWVADETPGSGQIDCGRRGESGAWLQRLADTSEFSYAEASLPDTFAAELERTASARLHVQGKKLFILSLDVTEVTRHDTDVAAIVAPEKVADTRRDRPYHEIRQILREELGLKDWK